MPLIDTPSTFSGGAITFVPFLLSKRALPAGKFPPKYNLPTINSGDHIPRSNLSIRGKAQTST